MEYLKFDIKLFIKLIITFMAMTVIGTLTHELGHYSVAKLLGYDARINYQSTYFWNDNYRNFLNEIYKKYPNEIRNDLDFPDKDKYITIINTEKSDHFWILLGGPLQTTITGSIGLLLFLIIRKRIIDENKVQIVGWITIFMSLFWLRQPANLFTGLLKFISSGKPPQSGDEIHLANYLGLNIWTIEVISGLIGILVLAIIFRLLPKNVVLTFLLSGLSGGILGYYLWIIKYGKYILP